MWKAMEALKPKGPVRPSTGATCVPQRNVSLVSTVLESAQQFSVAECSSEAAAEVWTLVVRKVASNEEAVMTTAKQALKPIWTGA